MSKHNGKNNGIEKHHFDNPSEVSHHDESDRTTSREALPIRDGISIAAAGEGDAPSEVRIYTKAPDTQFATHFSFQNPELLGDLIETLIAYRRYVFPDAPEINANATMEE